MKKLNQKTAETNTANKKTLKVVRVEPLSKPLDQRETPLRHDSAHSCCNP
jgi:hypothetical protein